MIIVGTMFLVAIAICSGCGQSPVVVSGSVTYRGQPVPKGAITFTPIEGTVASTTMTAIVDGKYSIEPARALPAGTYRVSITAIRGGSGRVVGAPVRNDKTPPPDPATEQQYIPAKYNMQSELKITVEGGNKVETRDFALTD